MPLRIVVSVFVCVSLALPLFGGDALWGKITEVRSGEVVVLNYGAGEYNVRVIGVDVPDEGPLAETARDFVKRLLLGREAGVRFEGRNKAGEMVGRVYVGEAGQEPVDVGLELVRNGLARRMAGFDYKYGQLSRAEAEARRSGRGLWATRPNQ